MSDKRVLLVEDDPALLVSLSDRLESEGFEVETATDGVAALALGAERRFDVIVLDVMLPRKGGYDVCRELRAADVNTPILMLTARGEIVDRVLGLKLGADDYLTKPFDMLELTARLEAIMRRTTVATRGSQAFAFGEVEVDFRSAEIERAGKPLNLSALELRLLRYFLEHPGEVLSRDELLDRVWGYDATPTTRTVDVHISSLRQKLEPNPHKPVYIVTIHGMGYKFIA